MNIRLKNARGSHLPGNKGEEGATLVEFALSCTIFMAMFFGVIEVSLAAYSYNFVSEAARDAARYALVRGSASCGSAYSPTMPDCAATEAQIQTHLQSLNYPGINNSNLTSTVVWYAQSGGPPSATWTTSTACSTAPAPSSCKAIGNAVKVTVNYAFPLSIPFWQNSTINMTNSSMMVISQ